MSCILDNQILIKFCMVVIRNDIISEPLAQKVFKYVMYLLSLLFSAFVFIIEVTLPITSIMGFSVLFMQNAIKPNSNNENREIKIKYKLFVQLILQKEYQKAETKSVIISNKIYPTKRRKNFSILSNSKNGNMYIPRINAKQEKICKTCSDELLFK